MNFYETMVKRLSKKKADRIARNVRILLRFAVTDPYYKISAINHPDYCNAFGIMQGIAYSLGYETAGITNRPEAPGFWFQQILDEELEKISPKILQVISDT